MTLDKAHNSAEMWGEDTTGHDTACDCKGCLLNEWEAERKQSEAEIERLRDQLERYRVALDRLGASAE
jgi:hypothetical protein